MIVRLSEAYGIVSAAGYAYAQPFSKGFVKFGRAWNLM